MQLLYVSTRGHITYNLKLHVILVEDILHTNTLTLILGVNILMTEKLAVTEKH
jgi:cell division protein FtsL